ncbi:hypothetical protein ACIPRL_07965 [Streptomyces sp. NPDC090085]|uniref:hypothetical protein n=1 Tax=Streptomyces sp. NPDC090085 TaxID=3365943 RepID=UPI00380A132F
MPVSKPRRKNQPSRRLLGHCARCRRACWSDSPDGPRWNAEVRAGQVVGIECPDCQTPEENMEAELKAATLDYRTMTKRADGRTAIAPRGGWHTAVAADHPIVEDKTVHLAAEILDGRLNLAVGPHSDARLHEPFTGAAAQAVRAALAAKEARPGTRTLTFAPMEDFGPDTIVFIEDQAIADDAEDRGELVVCFSPQMNPHLLTAFTPTIADCIRGLLAA